MEPIQERAVLVGVHLNLRDTLKDTTEESMKELADLAEAAGLEVVGEFVQNRHKLESGTYIGEGKIEEIAEFIRLNEIDKAIFDNELSGIQTRNLNKYLGVPIVDRSALVLDIFASRAESREGKLQVELAQLRYLLPRLVGSAAAEGVSRAGVGVGARGPGETKLETDRRQIHNRISALSEQLSEVAKNRNTQRRARDKDGVQTVALVGYTNAGKSTLLNQLTNAGIFAEDMLFATLDPTARKFTMPDGGEVIFIDTVGFIRKLPHHLIRAFSATLEESMLCDVILHVIDSSSPEMEAHIQVVDNLLAELNKKNKPILRVYNKSDLSTLAPPPDSVSISAKTGTGITELLEKVQELLPIRRRRITAIIPYSHGKLVAWMHDVSQIESETHLPEGTCITAVIAEKDLVPIEEFLTD